MQRFQVSASDGVKVKGKTWTFEAKTNAKPKATGLEAGHKIWLRGASRPRPGLKNYTSLILLV